jgi:superfamily II RNA helicase
MVSLPEEKERVRIPLHDSFYADSVMDTFRACAPGTRHAIRLFGVRPRHRAELRLTLIYAPINFTNLITSTETMEAPDQTLDQTLDEAHDGSTDEVAARSRMKEVLGFELDDFQKRALDAMTAGYDVLGMAPTGSGKTALALMAVVLRAFDVGKRAILTTPMKALSNQKFAEFSKWIKKVWSTDTRIRVSLLTGDIQARATPPGGDGSPELLIMTSELLANKLDASGIALSCTSNVSNMSNVVATPPPVTSSDPDLKDVAVVVMDEVHYINDDARGHVWERSMMGLAPEVQIVALSATLSRPERLCEWMSTRRPTRLVSRHDRHVPLHVGVFLRSTSLNGKRKLTPPRFYEVFRTGRRSTHDTSATCCSQQDFVSLFPDPHSPCLTPSLADLVDMLRVDDKLPAIVFMMSRARCVEAATSVSSANLLIPPRPIAPRVRSTTPGSQPDLLEMNAYLEAKALHDERATAVRREQKRMYDRYLRAYVADLDALPGFEEFKELLDRGIGYHHAGMLPVLREYVEILFQTRLLAVVFATETLGVGINMPARTVVLTQLDKPTDQRGQTRTLRPDEFWQMAGRSGRRGMDERGYVVFHPIASSPVTASNPSTWFRDLRALLLGSMPPIESKLRITPEFVLRCHAASTPAASSCLEKTLRKFDLERRQARLETERTDEITDSIPEEDVIRYERLVAPPPNIGGATLRLTPNQRKTREAEVTALHTRYDPASLKEASRKLEDRRRLEAEKAACAHDISDTWDVAVRWLERRGFVENVQTPSSCVVTVRGRVAARMVDGYPLVRGTVIHEGWLDTLDLDEVLCWSAIFAEPVRTTSSDVFTDREQERHEMSTRSQGLRDALVRATVLREAFTNANVEGDGKSERTEVNDQRHSCSDQDLIVASDVTNGTNATVMSVWLRTHDVREVCRLVPPAHLGSFVRMALRVLAFMDELDAILLGLQKYELHERLRDRHSHVLHGVVTNASLYVVEA